MATTLLVVSVLLLQSIHTISQDISQIDTVHMIFSNHFDCGFNINNPDINPPLGFAVNVVNTYFDKYFPNAVLWGDNFTNTYPNLTYSWMTQSWLISMYFNCPSGFGLHCPTQSAMDNIQNGIHKQYIYWHAFPFNSQQEIYDVSMLQFGLRLSRDLSNKHTAPISHIVSQRDVPALPRSIIPILLRNNITAISVGVNSGSTPPHVPRIFIWHDTVSNKSILSMWNPGGYGSPVLKQTVTVDKFDQALVFCWKKDNAGPPDPNEALSYYNTSTYLFPNASHIYASSITNFVDALLGNQQAVHTLPIINDEIGDTWQHGIQADPWKSAIHRAAQRERYKCLAAGKCSYDSVAFYNFSRLLLKNGEHTFGGQIQSFLASDINGSDYYAWSNRQLQAALAANNSVNNMTMFRDTWYEQRNWGCNYAVNALRISNNTADQQLYSNIMQEWNILTNVSSPLDSMSGWTKVNQYIFNVTSSYSGDQYEIEFDTDGSGALKRLMNMDKKINYATQNNLLGEFIYATYTEKDFDYFVDTYSRNSQPPEWMFVAFGKKGLDANAQPQHQYIATTFHNLYQMNDNKNKFLVQLNFGTNQSILQTKYGAPQYIYNLIDFDSTRATFTSDITWINKTATRIPEDFFYRFNPVNCVDWMVDKFDEMVDISKVVVNGTMHMHGTTGNVSCQIDADRFYIEPLDVTVSTFLPCGQSEYSPFPVPFVNASQVGGTAFVLYDNTWGTNYPVWFPFDPYQKNSTFRFNIFI